jgi:hypothetical protein
MTQSSDKRAAGAMTLIEIKPHRLGWKVFEAPGVEPVFSEKRQAIDYASMPREIVIQAILPCLL